MYSKRTVIVNKTGLHARPASDFTMKAMEYKSSITIKNLDNDTIHAIARLRLDKIIAVFEVVLVIF
jgi:phosphotransferase system HPr (HPr) family protein